MHSITRIGLAAASLCAAGTASADPVAVTPANFARAETDSYFAGVVARGGLGRFAPLRDFPTPEKSPVVRPNRDTLYSTALFDLDAGPVTIRLPEAGSRYFSMMVINEDHFIQAIHHGAGSYTIDRASVGTRYAVVGLRIFADPTRAGDLEAVHRLQDGVSVEQPGGPGRWVKPDWDPVSQGKVRNALTALGETLPNLDQAFGKASEVDPVAHLVGTAMAWGGLPRGEAIYLNVTPARNDGIAVYRLRVGEVPVDAFWSVTVYDRDGRLIANPQHAYSLNNLSARHAADHSVTIQFGGCAPGSENCLPVTPGWNYMVRLYRPRAEVLDSRWTFPVAALVED
jgi:hypothetical protein